MSAKRILALAAAVLIAAPAAAQLPTLPVPGVDTEPLLTARPAKASWRPDEKYFGTDAFVPDWRAAEAIDAKATALMDQDSVREIIAAMPYVHKFSPKSRVYMTEWHVGYSRLYQSSGKTLKFHARRAGSAEDLKYLAEVLPPKCAAMAKLKNVGGIDNTEERITNASAFQKLRVEVRDRILKLVKQ